MIHHHQASIVCLLLLFFLGENNDYQVESLSAQPIQSSSCFSTTPPPNGKKNTSNVFVWDNVIPTATQESLHQYASKSGLGHKAFTRPLSSSNNNNPIERVLDSILNQISDDDDDDGGAKYVEYWTRQQWRSIEAHADVDENLAKEQDMQQQNSGKNSYRYPTMGHVLYLKVGSEVLGPTCVFPNRKSGGELLVDNEHDDDDSKKKEVELLTVPAVPGRVLRFDGSALHAVPRPYDLWLLSFVKGALEHQPEDLYGRSVILFNTWKDPPLGVPLDDNSVVESGNNKHDSLVCEEECAVNQRLEWKEAYSRGNDIEEACAKDQDEEDKKMVPAKVWLLGNERRRDHRMRTVKLSAPEDKLRGALSETREVKRTILFHP
mmetsp:Transcript_6164/g.8921  ORF Transcript_6164/g.8921 Transcript_6164/m.8921 type:complete len:377 (+) Transcript_6164:44-1174(+)